MKNKRVRDKLDTIILLTSISAISILLTITTLAVINKMGTPEEPKHTEQITIDPSKVLVEINDTELTEGEFHKQVNAFKLGMTDSMVQAILIELAAKEKGVVVQSDEIEQQINQYKKQFKDNQEAFNLLLQQQGNTLQGLKYNIKQELLRERLTNKLLEEMEIPEEQLKEAYERESEMFTNIDIKFIVTYTTDSDDSNNIIKLIKDDIEKGKEFNQILHDYKGKIKKSDTIKYITKKDQLVGDKVTQSKVGDVFIKENPASKEVSVMLVTAKRESYGDVKGYIANVIKDSKRATVFTDYISEFSKKANIKYYDRKNLHKVTK